MKYISSQFYCCLCGNKGMMLPRKVGKERPTGHLKNLYCIYCKQVTRHYEAKSEEDEIKFRSDFNAGIYANEKENIIPFNCLDIYNFKA